MIVAKTKTATGMSTATIRDPPHLIKEPGGVRRSAGGGLLATAALVSYWVGLTDLVEGL